MTPAIGDDENHEALFSSLSAVKTEETSELAGFRAAGLPTSIGYRGFMGHRPPWRLKNQLNAQDCPSDLPAGFIGGL